MYDKLTFLFTMSDKIIPVDLKLFLIFFQTFFYTSKPNLNKKLN